jgi:hypothetical protein
MADSGGLTPAERDAHFRRRSFDVAWRSKNCNHPENPTLDLPRRAVFVSGQRPTEVVGPLLEDEAEALHEGVWKKLD